MTAKAQPVLEVFNEYLRKEGLKLTAPRRAILDAILSSNLSHFDADSLHLALYRAGRPRISRATVYRTLKVLVKGGILSKVQFSSSSYFYEPLVGRFHHDHMICVKCGKITEFVEPRIEALQDRICLEKRFSPTHHSLKIYGVCSACASKSK